jgi:ribosome-associated toxin RatA of RatAB toxin-antitoxin module
VPAVDIIDEVFFVVAREVARAVLCDESRWAGWFPGLVLTPYDDRGLDGVRWHLAGELSGTAEVWLQEHGDGTIVHAYLRGEPRRPAGNARRLHHWALARYQLPLKGHLLDCKARLEGSRGAAEPRVAMAERVVSPAEGERLPAAEGRLVMANQTTSSLLVAAPASQVMAVIADFASYPEWARGVTSAAVLTTYDDGRAAEVAFVLDAAPIRDEYTLRYDWSDDTQVTWSLVEAKMFKAMEGAYVLAADGEATQVTYRLSVELVIPMIGMLRRKGERVIIDTALKGLKQRVESVPR